MPLDITSQFGVKNLKISKALVKSALLHPPLPLKSPKSISSVRSSALGCNFSPFSLSHLSAKVFVHEAKQKDFLSAVDEIMKRLKSNNENIEINYRKVLFERQRPQEILSEGEIKIPD